MRVMRVIGLWLLVSTGLCGVASSSDDSLSLLHRINDWEVFKVRHGKTYNQKQEEDKRLATWLRNRERIERHNAEAAAGKHSYTLAENQFTDKEPDELASLTRTLPPAELLNLTIPSNEIQEPAVWNQRAVPASIDLRTHKCMAKIHNQGNCGSCWAYGALAPIEFQKCLKSGVPLSLSVQQLVDCSSGSGCNGGWYETAWRYLINSRGAVRASSYPYRGSSGACKRMYEHTVRIHTWTPVRRYSEAALKAALARYGPVVVAVFSNLNFMSYSGGIFDDPYCPTHTVNHAVVVVGYGTSKTGINYWIVRNSWGASWGMNGYMMIRRGVNRCNIGFYPAYPTAV